MRGYRAAIVIGSRMVDNGEDDIVNLRNVLEMNKYLPLDKGKDILFILYHYCTLPKQHFSCYLHKADLQGPR